MTNTKYQGPTQIVVFAHKEVRNRRPAPQRVICSNVEEASATVAGFIKRGFNTHTVTFVWSETMNIYVTASA